MRAEKVLIGLFLAFLIGIGLAKISNDDQQAPKSPPQPRPTKATEQGVLERPTRIESGNQTRAPD